MSNPFRNTYRYVRMMAPGLMVALFVLARPGALLGEGVTVGFANDQTGGQGIPAPWQLLGNPRAGTPDFRVEEEEQYGRVLRLSALGNQSDGIYRSANIDFNNTPYINFAWKVDTHPNGQIGTARDDQAVQIQLNFGRHGLKRRVLSYGFDAAAEAGRWYDDSSFVATNRVIVLNSGDERLGQWISHSRNVAKDYRSVYRGKVPRLQSVSIFTDSNDSNSQSLGYCSEITFSEEPQNVQQ